MGYAGGLIVTVSAWTVNEWAAVIGLLLGILTYLSGRFSAARREKREKRLAQLAEERSLMEKEAARLEVELKRMEIEGMKRRRPIREVPHDPSS
jgi:hypothetical protein